MGPALLCVTRAMNREAGCISANEYLKRRLLHSVHAAGLARSRRGVIATVLQIDTVTH